MFDKVRIRTKLIAIVAAPLAALLVLVGIGTLQRRGDAEQANRDAARIEVTERAATLAHAVQGETLVTTAYLGRGEKIGKDALNRSRAETDRAVSAYKKSVGDVSDLQVADNGAIQSLSSQLEFLPGLRAQVDEGTTGWSEISGQYFIFDDALQDLIHAFGAGIHDPDLAAEVRSVGALAGYASAASREGTTFTGILSEGSFSDQERNGREVIGEDLRAKYDEAVSAADTQLAVYQAGASAEDRTELRNKLSGPAVDLIQSARDAAAKAAFGESLTIDPVQYRRASAEQLDVLRGIESTQASALLDDAVGQASSSTRSAQLFVVLAAIITLIAIALAIAVSSSITRPLARLTEAVDQVATQQLPRLVESLRNPADDDVKLLAESVTDIESGGGVELEHLGEAVTAIQHVAVEVATEQATLLRKGIGDMFVNLARRNQALLDRQIEFIDQLEGDEEDPDRLDDLFKLDHMATRMRRNAESLLVLAGAEPARRRGRPVPLADVVRAALGEVEDYTRIDLLTLDDVLVKSGGALDVAHLLSELMENATHFSPPDTRVEIVGHRTRSEGYVVSVTDHGIGMTPDQMADANELLANPPLVGLAMSRSLGFIVIGRLAARIGVSVRLIPSPTGGVTGIVSLPSSIVEDTLPLQDDALPGTEVETPAAEATSEWSGPGGWDDQPSWMTAPVETLADAVPEAASLDDEFATLVENPGFEPSTDRSSEDAAAAKREHPSTWTEPTRSGPQARPVSEPGEDRGPEELPVRRPRAGASAADTAPSVAGGLPTRGTTTEAPTAEPVAELHPTEPTGSDTETETDADRDSGLPAWMAEPSPVAQHAEPEPEATPAEPLAETRDPFAAPDERTGLFGTAEHRSSLLPEPLLESGSPEPEVEAAPEETAAPAPLARRPAAVDRPPTDGLFSHDGPNGANGSAPAAPRLFGGPSERPNLPMPGGARMRDKPNGARVRDETEAAPVPAAEPEGERTSAGLVRRTPRASGEAARPRPGGESSPRGVTTTQRSPDEVRAMLSRFRSGQQQAAGSRDERGPNDDPMTDDRNGDHPNEDL